MPESHEIEKPHDLLERLQAVELDRVSCKIVDDPNIGLTGYYGPQAAGARTYGSSLDVVR